MQVLGRQLFEAQPGEEPPALDIRHILDVLWRRWPVITGAFGLIVAAALFTLYSITPRYTATAQVLIERNQENPLGADAIISEITFDKSAVDSQIQIITSLSLARRVVVDQNLTRDREFGPDRSPGLIERLRGLVTGADEADTGAIDAEPAIGSADTDEIKTAKNLLGAIEARRVGVTYAIEISVTSTDPDKAARLANAVADAYIVDQLEARYESAQRAATWLSDRLEVLRRELAASEEAVSRFRAEHNLVATATGTATQEQLAELNTKLVAARTRTAELRAKLDQAEKILSEGGSPDAIPDVVASPVIASLRTQLADVSRREADLAARYGDRHPSVINVRAERRDLQRTIAAEINRIVANLRNEYEVAKAAEGELERNVGILSGDADADNSVAVQLRQLERVAAANRALYEEFLSRAKLSEEQTSLKMQNARVISSAQPPEAPSFPNKKLGLAIGAFLGLGVGIGSAFLLETLRRGFADPDEIERRLGLPVLASVPLLAKRELNVDGRQLDPPGYLMAKPLSRFSEAVRMLRAGVQMADVDHPAKLVQVTSAVPGEGKSTIAVSLALSASLAKQKVLLIDADLRHPTVSRAFGLSEAPGLVDFLTGTVGEGLITVDEASGVHVLPAGSSSRTPADLLGSGRNRTLLEKIRERYDYVVIDAPPVEPVVDARVLSSAVDKIVFVVSAEETPREIVERAIRMFADRKIAGVAFNRVDTSGRKRYGHYYYDNRYYRDYYRG